MCFHELKVKHFNSFLNTLHSIKYQRPTFYLLLSKILTFFRFLLLYRNCPVSVYAPSWLLRCVWLALLQHLGAMPASEPAGTVDLRAEGKAVKVLDILEIVFNIKSILGQLSRSKRAPLRCGLINSVKEPYQLCVWRNNFLIYISTLLSEWKVYSVPISVS